MIFFSERTSKNNYFSLRSRLEIMHLPEQTTNLTSANSFEATKQDSTDWSRAFNTSILSTVLDSNTSSTAPDAEIEAILATPEYAAILVAAQNLATSLQISPEAATERLIKTFRNIDQSWNQLLLKKGAQSLLGL